MAVSEGSFRAASNVPSGDGLPVIKGRHVNYELLVYYFLIQSPLGSFHFFRVFGLDITVSIVVFSG